jgi:predicted RNase H-like nuclease
MAEEKELTTDEIIARRRAMLFNVKARNLKVRDIFSDNSKKEKELEIERDKISVALMQKAGIKDVDELLTKIERKKGGDIF